MKFIHHTFVKQLTLVTLAISLTSCYSLTDLWGESKSDALESNLSNTQPSFVTSNNNQISINEFIQEWETVRPALMRVVALEEDMQYLVQSLSDMNAVGPVYGSVDSSSDLRQEGEPQYETAQAIEFISIGNSTKKQASLSKFSEAPSSLPEQPNSNVEIVAAPRLIRADNAPAVSGVEQQNFEIDTKFSSTPNQSPSIKAAVDQSLSRQSKELSDCSDFTNKRIGEGNAIHLVSYKSKQFLRSGSDKLSAQFAQVLCGKMPLFKEVNVNGSLFYSMRFGPFINKNEALQACSDIKKTGQYCGVTDFVGTQIL